MYNKQMLWLALSLLTAFSDSLKDIFSKKALKDVNEYTTSWFLRLSCVIFTLPLLIASGIPRVQTNFLVPLFASAPLKLIATTLYLKAIKTLDLSLVLPMLNFTPAFLLITSYIMLGEIPNTAGLIGVILVVAGSYILNIKNKQGNYLQPIFALIKQKETRLMLIVAFIWSITSNIDKIGVKYSSPAFWVVSDNALTTSLLTLMLSSKQPQKVIKETFSNYKTLILAGVFGALALVFQMMAVKLTLVSYVISIKRLSIVISIILGHMMLKETLIKNRLLGALTMLFGVLLIALFN